MKHALLASILLGFMAISHAQAPSAQKMEQLLATIPNAQVGLFIQDANSKEVLYTHNAKQSFTPASVTKSYTVAAAIVDLDPNFAYQTRITYDKNHLQDGILHGDLALVFSGDPSFTTESLLNLLTAIPASGIKTISGNITIDNSYFSEPYDGRGWVADDLNWYFGSVAKSVMIDENQIPLTLTTDAAQIHVQLSNPNYIVPISNDLVGATPQAATDLCQINVETHPQNNGIRLYGCWPMHPQQKPTTLKAALANPELYVSTVIAQYLRNQDIKLQGEILVGATHLPDTLASHASPTLAILNIGSMQRSNNIYADSLAKVLGKKHEQRGTLQAGSFAIAQILKSKLGLDMDTVRLYDGSGLSTYNQITPQAISELYLAMYAHPQYQKAYLDTLHVNDAQHTFYSRLPENMATDVYIKTGSMTGVSNVTGYIKTQSGKMLIVVSLINQLPQNKSAAREFERQLIEYWAKM